MWRCTQEGESQGPSDHGGRHQYSDRCSGAGSGAWAAIQGGSEEMPARGRRGCLRRGPGRACRRLRAKPGRVDRCLADLADRVCGDEPRGRLECGRILAWVTAARRGPRPDRSGFSDRRACLDASGAIADA